MPRTARRRPRVSLRCCVFTLLALAVGVVHLAAQIAAPPKVAAPQAVAKPEELPPHVAVDADEDEDEREDFEGDAARSARVRVVFSTDCTPYQDWQSEVVFNSADVVGHRGPVTRVASGCSAEKEAALRQRYAALYGARARFSLHVTPEFDKDSATGKSYHFYNKPRGMEHFLNDRSIDFERAPIIALIDPDFAFLRPFSDRVAGPDALVIAPWRADELPAFVVEGTPAGQQYGLGTHWLTFDRKKICGAGSPCLETSRRDAEKHYPIGPPYVLHHNDFRKLAPVWREFAPRVYAQYPDLLAEMYAYCMAAAHLRMPHARVNHWMLSNVHVGDEGWRHLDALALRDACPARGGKTPNVVDHATRFVLPAFLHYCQNYRVGDFIFAKRRVPPALFTDCAHPPLLAPGLIETQVDYELHPPGNPCREAPQRKPLGRSIVNRTAAAVCLATWHVNAAATRARKRFCDARPPAPVKLFTLATTCAPGMRGFHNNAKGGS